MPPPDDNPADLPRAKPVFRDPTPKYEPEPDEELTSNDKTMGLLAHLLGLLTGFIGPAILLLATTDKSEFAHRHTKESLNFQVSLIFEYLLIVLVAALIGLTVWVASSHVPAALIVGYVFMILASIAMGIVSLVFIIKAAIAANKGQDYRYPLTIRLF